MFYENADMLISPARRALILIKRVVIQSEIFTVSPSLIIHSQTIKKKSKKMLKLILVAFLLVAANAVVIDRGCEESATKALCVKFQPATTKECMVEHKK